MLVHCRGGLGRAGTIAARLLVELGMQPTEAIAGVRAVRPGAIETSDQEKFVLGIRTARKLADLGETLRAAVNRPVKVLWKMQNGYALCTRTGLDAIAEHLSVLQPEQLDILRGKLRIGIHRDVEVTDAPGERRPLVSQAFCSALPVAYSPCHPLTGTVLRHWSCKQRTKPPCGPPC